ncbi:LacI family DNA-binding transcriptional regulator [Lachnoanaerobaculum gingivalis]|uniref:LacI family DNA-binding transcriptional regulator n=1 Tax=Lachnoanaerobaculum gingivalis TaxID=2490855 RepID=A0A3P3QWP3_9FIRM|nr:LacI family DNA-binding transcriptional regulator [Lachnoanaerobaculum gingivalis]RRJ25544.1 LacI family DNA-binding transcriptional regulator [Lachnoanaerobaculum gingivalis]
MSSIQEVAKKAGVGVGTVSRVINDSGYVSEKTRKKVEEVIEELNYKPNELARNLFRNRTNIVAVITPAIGNPYYATLYSEVENRLRKYGYKTMLCNTIGEATNEEAYLEMLERNMVDGIITGTHTLDYSSYKKIKGPIVGFDTPKLNDDILIVTVDHEKGGKLAAKALIESGCKEVLQFTDATTKNYPFIKRHKAFAKEIKKAGLICREYKPNMDNFEEKFIQENIDEAFSMYPNVDGVFATDTHALLYMKKALSMGKRVPHDLKVVAYDGTFILNTAYPSPSAIVQPIDKLAKVAVDSLHAIINGEKVDRNTKVLDIEFRQGMTTN